MTAQNCQKNVFLIGIFKCLLAQNLTNQDSQLSWFFQTIWKTVR